MDSIMQQVTTEARKLTDKLHKARETYDAAVADNNLAAAQYAAAKRKLGLASNDVAQVKMELDDVLNQITEMAEAGRIGLEVRN